MFLIYLKKMPPNLTNPHVDSTCGFFSHKTEPQTSLFTSVLFFSLTAQYEQGSHDRIICHTPLPITEISFKRNGMKLPSSQVTFAVLTSDVRREALIQQHHLHEASFLLTERLKYG